ncbi:hypothetical protein TCAL_09051 [Tigriopus californicus]|uniref:Uncharacterized protein n=2 Tax=Tigriopus californicus TaxID=6832 RepID=A0A553P348_TIGCA|nr:hypothetical protein TCAL_09051 [Tigriopus californicus]|eukprot:TCALIF_09051-PA protein Name:"Similar to Glutamate receptor (Lymnaea stagnalis)" AED:0.46 eAED:0.46 QI:0/-1/0/1/-1/1/1/0/542
MHVRLILNSAIFDDCAATLSQRDWITFRDSLCSIPNDIQGVVLIREEYDEIPRCTWDQCNSNALTIIPSNAQTLPCVIRLDSSLFMYQVEGLALVLSEVYAIQKGPLIFNHIGIWTEKMGLQSNHSLSKWERRTDLSTANLRVALFKSNGLSKNSSSEANTDSVSRYFIRVFQILQQNLNFSFEPHINTQGAWGSKESGTWNGIVGMLHRNEADIGMQSLSITKDRNKVIDFSTPLIFDKLTFIKGNELQYDINYWIYINIFRKEVWFGIAIIIALGSAIFSAISWLQIDCLHEELEEKFGVANGFALTCATMLQRDYLFERKHVVTRITFMSLCLGSYCLLAFYGADLTSGMTVHPRPTILRSMNDIIGKDFQIRVVGASANSDLFIYAPVGTPMNRIYETLIKTDPNALMTPKTDDEVISMVSTNEKILYFASILPYRLPNSPVTILSLVDMVDDAQGFGFQKNSEFLELFDFHILKLEESGVARRIRSELFPIANQDVSVNAGITLGFENLIFPFLMLFVGIGISALFVLSEFVRKRFD